MTAVERAAQRRNAHARSRNRARDAQLMADIAHVLEEAHAALSSLPNAVVRTPSGPTTVKDITGQVGRLLQHSLASSRRKVSPVSAVELAAGLEAVLVEGGPCTPDTCENRPAARRAVRLLARWKGLGTTAAPPSAPPSPATTKETE
jgi:hypothetical protein